TVATSRFVQHPSHHPLGLFHPDGATLFVEVSGDSPILVGFIGSYAQVISHPLHPRPQCLVPLAPPLGLVSRRVALPHVPLYCLVVQSTSHGLDALFAVTPLDSRLQA